MRYSMLLVLLTGCLLINITYEQRGGEGYGRVVPGLAQSYLDKQIEDLAKRVERKKREESLENDLNSNINGNTLDEYDD